MMMMALEMLIISLFIQKERIGEIAFKKNSNVDGIDDKLASEENNGLTNASK